MVQDNGPEGVAVAVEAEGEAKVAVQAIGPHRRTGHRVCVGSIPTLASLLISVRTWILVPGRIS